ncbi:VOC family protein [Sinomicrobium weinanense]|nr:VOC family protein [Sinomicrobium weinanense]
MSITKSLSQDFNFKKDHDAILVKDLDKSAGFYAEIFGLEEIYNAGLGENFRWFQLNDKVQIHLIKSNEDFKPHKGVHLAINTDDLEGFMEFLRSKKVHFENWPGKANTTNTRPDGIKQIYIEDPDGYWIEVNDNKL